MPVFATPCSDACPDPSAASPVACPDQGNRVPRITVFDEEPLYSRMRSISVQQGQSASITWTVVDPDGKAVDLSTCPNAIARLRVAEALGITSVNNPPEVIGTITNAATGEVKFTLDKDHTALPGIYFAQVDVVENPGDAETVYFSNTFYLIVNRGVNNLSGPPSIAEIRLHLRDSSPVESRLLTGLKFDDAEIALAIQRPIEYFNQTPPILSQQFTTQNFPYRYQWLNAICAQLFWIAAEHFRANDFQYSAGGVQVRDTAKEIPYERAAQRLWEEWRRFVATQKMVMNIDEGWGTLGSGWYWW